MIYTIQNNLPPHISVVGYEGVGKTTITNLVKTKNIPLIPDHTISGDIASLNIGKIKILIRDFTGDAEIGFLWNYFIKGSDAVLIITDSTLENIERSKFFLGIIDEETPFAYRIVIGNKCQLENSLKSSQIEEILGLKTYSISILNQESRNTLIQIFTEILEMSDTISPILDIIKKKEFLLKEFEKAIIEVDIERLDSIYYKILEICEELGENPVEMEFYKKYQDIMSRFSRTKSSHETLSPSESIEKPGKTFQSITSLQSLLRTLLSNYIYNVNGIIGVIVSDREGFVIISESKKDPGDESVLGAIAVTIDTYIERIKREFSNESSFFNITTIQDKKFAYCSTGLKSILLTIS
ncbi:MAG: ADP-ribosylation factor-like protein, partial [Candidatus Thorarchaeota archaeon]